MFLVPQAGLVSYDSHCMLWPYMLANAPTVLSLAGRGFLLRTPEGGGLGIPLFGLKYVPLNRIWFSEF